MDKIEHDGFDIHYRHERRSAGSVSNSPIFLHHGLAQSAEHWFQAGWFEALGERDIIAVDMLGHGASDRPEERESYSIEKRAEAIIAIADKIKAERFIFFGFSLGGRVGFELAASFPDSVDRLVVGGMHGLDPNVDRKNLERRIAVLRSPKWRLVERAVGAHRIEGPPNSPDAMALSTEAVLDWRGATERLPSVDAPTLLFCGSQDSLIEYARQTAELMPACQFVEVPGANHAASFYTSDLAKSAVSDFVNNSPGG